jgi:hypothetical protein
MISRRQFLTRFAAVPIAATILLPSAKSIFLPPRGGWPVGDGVALNSMAHPWVDHGTLYTYTYRARFLAPNLFSPDVASRLGGLPEESLTADSLDLIRQELERNHAVGAEIQLLRDGEPSNVVWTWSAERVRREAAQMVAATEGLTDQFLDSKEAYERLYREITV